MEFTTTQFESSHGKKPRGHGHWAFDVTVQRGHSFLTEMHWAVGTLSAAKASVVRAAKQGAPGSKVVRVEVLP